jgi:hypothetical protein
MLQGFRGHYVDVLTSASHLGLLAFAAHSGEKTVWLVCLTLIALISFFAWASSYKRVRAIADIPTSRVASAAQGYVELFGRASIGSDNLIVSPLSGTSCIWFRYWVYTRDNEKDWRETASGVSTTTFEISDGTGKCHIDPDNAEVITPDRRVSYEGNYKHVEDLLYGGGSIYALGELTTLGGANSALDMKEDVNALLAEWKKSPAVLRERFDMDKNGEVDVREWELARRAAVREVQLQHREIRAISGVNVMRAPRDGRLFLLSSLSPQKLRNKYLLWSVFHLVILISAASAALWLWQGHYFQELFA